tara:strand:+ start:68 stop:1243 length:1176 start_codon:yes stop_codon:yes gene_type:complete
MDINFLINDSRKSSSFSKTTFSDYKKTEVIKLFEKNLILSKLHDACFIAIELHISLYNNIILETVFNLSSLYTNIDYPEMPNVLFQLYLKYQNALKETNNKNLHLDNRNNQEIRNVLSHVVSLACLSPKNNNFQLDLSTKISNLDFEYFIVQKNIKSKDLELTKDMFFENESKELVLVLNEIAYLLREEKDNSKDIFYWISWITELEKTYKKKKIQFNLKPRKIENISEKLSIFWEWILWNIILNETYFRNKPELYQQIYALYNFYKFNFKKSSRQKYLIYINHSIFLLKKNIDFNINPLKKQQDLVIQSILGNNHFYKMIFDKQEQKYYIEEKQETETKKTQKKIQDETNTNLTNKVNSEDKQNNTRVILNKKQLEEKRVNERMNYLFLY